MMRFDAPDTWPYTWKERCEIIASDLAFLNYQTGETKHLTAIELWNFDPFGEISQLLDIFIDCLIAREYVARAESGEPLDSIKADMTERVKRANGF